MTKPSYEEHEAGCRCDDGGSIGWKHHSLCSLRKLAWQHLQDTTNQIRDSIELEAELARVRGLLQRLFTFARHDEDCPAWGFHRPTGAYWADGDEKRCTCQVGKLFTEYACKHVHVKTEIDNERCEDCGQYVWDDRKATPPVHSGAESADIGKLDTVDKSGEVEILRIAKERLRKLVGDSSSLLPMISRVEAHFARCKAGSAETGGEKAAPHFSADEQRKIAKTQACMDSVGEKWVHPERYSEYERGMGLLFAWEWDTAGSMSDCEFAEVIAAAVQRASTFPRTSQNQTVSSGVEGAHEGTTVDKSGSKAAGFIRGAREGWMRACVFYLDIDAEYPDSKYTKDMNERWPLADSREPEKLNNAQGSGWCECGHAEEDHSADGCMVSDQFPDSGCECKKFKYVALAESSLSQKENDHE